MSKQYRILPNSLQVLKPLSDKKPVYAVVGDPSLFVKVISTENKSKTDILNEIKFQKKAYKAGIPCPKVIDHYWYNGSMYLVMERIWGNNLANIYGTNPKRIPTWIWNKMRDIVSDLYDNDIEYCDITAYNFMKTKDNKIVIVDFEHCSIVDEEEIDWFVDEFINGSKSWNPDWM